MALRSAEFEVRWRIKTQHSHAFDHAITNETQIHIITKTITLN